MRKLQLSLSIFCLAICCNALRAQTFTDKLQADVNGQGSIQLIQDQRLFDLINGLTSLKQQEETKNDTEFNTTVVRKKRLKGYRIQMYWGNSTRADQQKAQSIGRQVTNAYPELQAYTTFDSPHWRCRVGDFKTRPEAAKYLYKLRKISKDAMIVRSEIIAFE